MKNPYRIFIIDDHEIIVDAYKKSLLSHLPSCFNTTFSIDSANNCEIAYEKINLLSGHQKYDLILLDIILPPCTKHKINSGEELGLLIKKKFPDIKIVVITSLNNNYRLYNILKSLNPIGFLLKVDIDSFKLNKSIELVIKGTTAYSKSVIELMRKRITNSFYIDELDIKILLEISNGTRPIDMTKHIPLSKAGIEKRKRILRQKFDIDNYTDRKLILEAKRRGFI